MAVSRGNRSSLGSQRFLLIRRGFLALAWRSQPVFEVNRFPDRVISQLRARINQTWRKISQLRAKINHAWRKSANFGRESTKLGEKSANFGRESTKLGEKSANFGRESTKLGEKSANFARKSTNSSRGAFFIKVTPVLGGAVSGVQRHCAEITHSYQCTLSVIIAPNRMLSQRRQPSKIGHTIPNTQKRGMADDDH
ncbi:hypothetical protein [Bacillus massilinigeriensis]|uniref:hypothetical protein n=1 Tax=Bacillus mediterraneensis TaxID=1805474 RepID=UPI00114D3F97|nr:hypothetical protein [Bacillus mediterraneensis]